MYIIIPYRDRKKDLEKMLETIDKLKKEWDLEIKILLCEQMDNNKFNKGNLINCGIHYLQSINYNSTIVIHDVDIYPKLEAKYLYQDSNYMCHLYGLKHCFGGIMLSNISNFIKTNGYSNNYAGWGREDTDFKLRCEYFKIPIDNSRFQERYKSDFFEEEFSNNKPHNLKNVTYFNKCKKNPKLYLTDGLSNIRNTYYMIEQNENYIWLKIKKITSRENKK